MENLARMQIENCNMLLDGKVNNREYRAMTWSLTCTILGITREQSTSMLNAIRRDVIVDALSNDNLGELI